LGVSGLLAPDRIALPCIQEFAGIRRVGPDNGRAGEPHGLENGDLRGGEPDGCGALLSHLDSRIGTCRACHLVTRLMVPLLSMRHNCSWKGVAIAVVAR
jgi:hypothetical protein